jgi:hypothetical protein
VLDDDPQLDDEAAVAQLDVDALLDPPRHEPREPSAAGERDDAVALRGSRSRRSGPTAAGAIAIRPRSVVAITNGSRSMAASL